MNFHECSVAGAREISPTPHDDNRGHFLRAWCHQEFMDHGIKFTPVQANMAFSRREGTIRGLHYQAAPAPEAKLVRCTRGAIFDVVVDLRQDSPTYLSWHGLVLSAENAKMLYVPEGCAHGALSLVDDTDLHYMASANFAPKHAFGVRFDDPAFNVQWPIPVTVVSEQDGGWPPYHSS